MSQDEQVELKGAIRQTLTRMGEEFKLMEDLLERLEQDDVQ